MKKFFVSMGILTAAVIAAGCNGGQSNPLEGNEQYNNLTPLHDQTKLDQTEPTSPFQIDVDGNNDVNFAAFVEGQATSVKFEVRVLLPAIQSYTVVPVDIPQGATFTQASDDPNGWVMTWMPPIGTVVPGTPDAQLSIQLEAQVTKTTDSRLANFVSTKSIEITVNKSQEVPTIVGISGFSANINEGDRFSFSVEVNDPTSNGVPPTLYRYPYNQGPNLENFKTDASVYVLPDHSRPVVHLANGDWQFNYVFDTEGRDLPIPLDLSDHKVTNAAGVSVCFNLKAETAYGNDSAEKPVCTYIKYASQTPTILWNDVNPVIPLTAGSAGSVVFTAASPNGRGQVEVENVSTGFSTWPGQPKLTCTDPSVNSASRTCTLDWNIPCSKQVRGSYILNIKVTNATGQSVKTFTDRRQLEISTDSCPAAPVATTPKAVVAHQIHPGQTNPTLTKTTTRSTSSAGNSNTTDQQSPNVQKMKKVDMAGGAQ